MKLALFATLVQSVAGQEAIPRACFTDSGAPPQFIDVTVLMVRHGERIDETFHQMDFRAQSLAGKVWMGDPWLSEHGERQANETAQNVLQSIGKKQEYFQKVFTSPLQRAIHTAEPLSRSLNKPLEIVNSLSGLETQIHRMGLKPQTFNRMEFYKEGHFTRDTKLQYKVNQEDENIKDFWAGLDRIARQNCINGKSHLLIVTHRESIMMAGRMAHMHYSVPDFASVTGFQYALSAGDKKSNFHCVLPTTNKPFETNWLTQRRPINFKQMKSTKTFKVEGEEVTEGKPSILKRIKKRLFR